jgi:ABC-type dipeptide/oligopeptide/nickel transport system permease subunit
MSSRNLFDDPMKAVVVSGEAALEDPAEEMSRPSLSPLQASLRRFRRNKVAMTSLFVLLSIGLLTIIIPPIYEHIGQPLHEQIVPGYVLTLTPEQYRSPEYLDTNHLMEYPSALHWLGTDDTGQDILARLLKGIQVSLIVALAIEVQDVVLGVFFGVLAGYYGGILDKLLIPFIDLMFAFPGLLLAILVAAIFGRAFDDVSILGIDFGPYGRVLLLIPVLGVLIWPQMARYVRGETLRLKEQPFVEAARTGGAGSLKIILRHILPNMGNLILVAAVLDLTGNLGAESTLSLLGLGVQEPGAGLGLMTGQYAPYLQVYGYEMIWPILAVVVLVLACIFVGDGLEAAFDPRDQDYGAAPAADGSSPPDSSASLSRQMKGRSR